MTLKVTEHFDAKVSSAAHHRDKRLLLDYSAEVCVLVNVVPASQVTCNHAECRSRVVV